MSVERTRERIIEMVNQMRKSTVENGCTPGEAAKFAAKVAEWIEKYQIDEAELRAKQTGKDTTSEEIEVTQNVLRTGKKVFNPGMTQVVNALSQGMCCRTIMVHRNGEALYEVIGDELDANYVCQIATYVVPALQVMGRMEGAEHGEEKAGLVRWLNQYLTGAAEEILRRLIKERKDRSEARKLQSTCTALALVTGDSLAVIKQQAADDALKQLYPVTRTVFNRSQYNSAARERGREAGKTVGLDLQIK